MAKTVYLNQDIMLLPSRAIVILSICSISLTAGFIAFLLLTSYSQKSDVDGWIDTIGKGEVLYPEGEGIIEAVLVQTGDIVVRDQPLLVVGSNDAADLKESQQDLLLNSLNSEMQLLHEQMLLSQQRHEFEIEQGNARIGRLQAEVESFDALLQFETAKFELIKTRVSRAAELRGKGFISQQEMDSLTLDIINQEIKLHDLISQKQRILDRIDEEGESLQSQKVDYSIETSQFQERIEEMNIRRSDATRKFGYVIKAPFDGRIDLVQAYAGMKISDGDPTRRVPLISINPTDEVLKVFMLLPAELASGLAINSTINFRIKSKLSDDQLSISGVVSYLSETPFRGDQILNNPIQQEGKIYYAIIDPANEGLTDPKIRQILFQGNEVTASLELTKKSLFEWIFIKLGQGR